MRRFAAVAASVPATVALAAVATLAFSAPASAGNPQGRWQIKLLGSAVLPDGKIDQVKNAALAVGEALAPLVYQSRANDNVVPTMAIEYFFTSSLSLETICCVTQHDVDGTAQLTGAELVSDAKIIPATFTLKYHVDAGAVRPYLGVGPSYFIFIDEKPGAFMKAAFDAQSLKLKDSLGLALQAGADIPLNGSGLSLALDAKKYFLKTDATWRDGNDAELLKTRQNIAPWVLSAGLAWRF